jgi:putative ribosome biogenesis GTPase RsgA
MHAKYNNGIQIIYVGVEEQESNVTAGYIQELRELFLKKGIVGVQRMMTDKLAEWRNVKINLAILGNSGAGKSSFINAIRG